MKADQWRGLFWIVGLGSYLFIGMLSIMSFDLRSILILVFGSHLIILPTLFLIQHKITKAAQKEGGIVQDAVKRLEKRYPKDKRSTDRPKYVNIAPAIKPGLSEEEHRKVEQMLRDWAIVQEEMK